MKKWRRKNDDENLLIKVLQTENRREKADG